MQISDFGMSRNLMDENYYISHGGKIPVKWTAPEVRINLSCAHILQQLLLALSLIFYSIAIFFFLIPYNIVSCLVLYTCSWKFFCLFALPPYSCYHGQNLLSHRIFVLCHRSRAYGNLYCMGGNPFHCYLFNIKAVAWLEEVFCPVNIFQLYSIDSHINTCTCSWTKSLNDIIGTPD